MVVDLSGPVSERLAQRVADGVHGVQGAVRVLEHALESLGRVTAHLAGEGGAIGDVDAPEIDASRGGCRQAEDAASDRGLAGAALAHDADRLAGGDTERHAAQRDVFAAFGPVRLAQVGHGQDGVSTDRRLRAFVDGLDCSQHPLEFGAADARRPASGCHLDQGRCATGARVLAMRAPVGERAPIEHGPGGRDRPGHPAEVGLVVLDRRHRLQQPGRVRVQGRVTHRRRGRRFGDRSRVHHRHTVAHREGEPQVVRDEHQAHTALLLDAAEQFEHLVLRGGVECGAGLVGHQQRWVVGERRGQRHSLRHAAGQLERVTMRDGGVGDAHLGEATLDLGLDAAGGVSRRAEGLGDVATRGHHRVEHGERVLHQQRDRSAAVFAGPTVRIDRLTVEADRATRRQTWGQQRHQRPRRQRLARTALADQPDRLAGAQLQRDAPRQQTIVDGDVEALDVEQQIAGRSSGSRPIGEHFEHPVADHRDRQREQGDADGRTGDGPHVQVEHGAVLGDHQAPVR